LGGTPMNNNDYREERFDSFLNKTIIMSSKDYFRKQMQIIKREPTIVDDENYTTFLQEFIEWDCAFLSVENKSQLNNAVRSLSAIEQSVIFLLFQEEFSQDEASKILDICSKSVSRIKLRAVKKLKNYLEGDYKDGK
jgi:RNA polymerase sigma factor (sigma-70 family)